VLIEGAHCVLGGPLCVCGAISLSSLSRGKRCGFGPICASFAFRFLNLDGNGIDFEPIPRQAGELRVKQGGLALLVSGAHALEGWELPLFFEIFTSTRGV